MVEMYIYAYFPVCGYDEYRGIRMKLTANNPVYEDALTGEYE